MGRVRTMRRVATTLLLAVAAVGAWAGVASAGSTAAVTGVVVPDTVVEQPFAADSGDTCRYGVTKGTIFWQLGPMVGPPSVGVKGVLADRPLAGEPTVCRDDRRFSVLTVVAFVGDREVDRELIRVDNDVRDYRFVLTNDVSAARITKLSVVICRPPIEVGVPVFCGRKLEFEAPVN